MENGPLGNLLVDDDCIAKAVRLRNKPYIEKTLSASSKELLEEKAALEARDSWEILRRNQKSFRMKWDKSISEKLEDFVWVTLAHMGFDELSDGRQFCIDLGNGTNPRQIDVFAKDAESVVIVECTTCERPTKKDMTDLIQKIDSLRGGVGKAIRKHYGKESKLKIRWCIATKHVDWRGCDLDKALAANIVVLRESELSYYSKLTGHLKKAAKYQFLSHLFADEEISGLKLAVPATKGRMGKLTFYNFLMGPADLLKVAYVSHKASRSADDLEAYQRMLKPRRLQRIASYVDAGGQFPTNIVINMKSKKNIRFDKKERVGDAAFGVLYLPARYASCWIIDGQHRLYGYAQSKRMNSKTDKTALPVLAYNNLSATDEAKMFVDINCEQVRVTKSLLNELYSNLRWDSDDYDERVDALCTRVVMAMDINTTSPFYDCIIISNRDKTHQRCLTLTSFNDGLRNQRFFGREGKHGPLFDSTSESLETTKKKAVAVLTHYFDQFRNGAEQNWNLGDEKGGYLCTNNGVRALLMVLRELLRDISISCSIDLDVLSADDIKKDIEKLSTPIVEHFANATSEEIETFRGRQALKGVRKNAVMMMHLIHEEIQEFLPTALEEYLDSVDEEGTDDARALIDQISKRLYSFTLDVLKDHYQESWWYDGVPEKARIRCTERQQIERGEKKAEQYLNLINYRDIALRSWELFQPLFSLGEGGGKTKVTQWLIDLNKVRNITHHTEKWPATKEQVKSVREIHGKLCRQFEVLSSET